MTLPQIITQERAAGLLSWPAAVEAIRQGHLRPRASIADAFLGPAEATMVSRGAFVPGLGYGVKAFTVYDGNAAAGLPTVQGAMIVFDPQHGGVSALIDCQLVTAWKTAADSVLGATLLARPDSRRLLIIGAGQVAKSLIQAYAALFPHLDEILIWARRPAQAQALIDQIKLPIRLAVAEDLPQAVAGADMISAATLARTPILRGDWVQPGTHVDLIGAFKADMREADDTLIRKARLFVDSRETTMHHIGELKIPLASGVLQPADVLGDLYDLVASPLPARRTQTEITLYKNGGGAHLDLMTACYIAQSLQAATG